MSMAARHYQDIQRSSAPDPIVQHAELVRRIAHHLAARLPASVEIDDLVQAGMIGLLEASRSYDADQGASFETYASIRIRGSMIDEIRRGDWVPRSVHRRVRDAAEATRRIEQKTGRAASARATPTRCCWPPDNSCGRRSRKVAGSSCTSSSNSSTRSAMRAVFQPSSRGTTAIFSATVRCGNRP